MYLYVCYRPYLDVIPPSHSHAGIGIGIVKPSKLPTNHKTLRLSKRTSYFPPLFKVLLLKCTVLPNIGCEGKDWRPCLKEVKQNEKEVISSARKTR